ncbi:MAG: hypothetical protein WCO60_19165 [Verrucomicrobiota bacterium]
MRYRVIGIPAEMMDVNALKRLKEQERENAELKELLAEGMLKNRALEGVCEKAVSQEGRRAGAKAVEEHGAPKYIRSDNGTEFIAKIVQEWLRREKIKTI